MAQELWRKSALELAADIRTKKVSSREVVDAHLERIAQVNGHVNAVVRVLADEARAGADAADAALAAGKPLGVFHGVPFTIKENIDVVGYPTTQGIPALAQAIPTLNAPAVDRMLGAGAIPIGRTNLPDLGLRIHTDSALYGRTKNPWKADRTAGGSSGGEGAALASGMSPIGLGNDIGGSLRNPAHCCGIAAIKPSTGVIPDANQFPIEDAGLSSQLMLIQGVMARRIADVRAGFMVVAGEHPRDPISVPAVLTDLQPEQKLRIAVMATPPGGSTHAGVADVVRKAADALSNAGHDVIEINPPDFELACEVWKTQLYGEYELQRPLLEMVMGEGGRKFVDFTTLNRVKVDLAAWANAQLQRNGLGRRWSLWFQDYPVLLSPTWTQPPFVFNFDIEDEASALATVELMRPVLPANLLGLPAVVVPGGMADSLPVGVQVIGARYTDLRCLSIAEQIESACGLDTPIDPIN
jgi:amidase